MKAVPQRRRPFFAAPASPDATPCALNVPSYFLYGEGWTEESFGFFHIEPFYIRNVPNNWRIGPHRHPDFHQLSIAFQGSCVFEHDGNVATSAKACCVFTPATVVHQFTYEPGTVGHVISVSQDFMAGLMLGDGPMKTAISRLGAVRLIELADDGSGRRLQTLVSLIADTFAYDRHGRREMIQHLFGACLLELSANAAEASGANGDDTGLSPENSELFNRFRDLLEHTFDMADRSGKLPDAPFTVDALAARLSTTPYALNASCKRTIGRAAKEIIRTALLAQATRLLLYTNRSVKEIAYGLGYSHPSHFVRFFKHQRDMTPEGFRHHFIGQGRSDSQRPTANRLSSTIDRETSWPARS